MAKQTDGLRLAVGASLRLQNFGLAWFDRLQSATQTFSGKAFLT
jgi:hypothetical protein